MYIRVKRNKTTYFIQCDPTETTLNIKQKLHSLIDRPPSDQQLILLATNDVLDESKTLANQKVLAINSVYLSAQVENDAVVALTLRKGSEDSFRAESIFYAHLIQTESCLRSPGLSVFLRLLSFASSLAFVSEFADGNWNSYALPVENLAMLRVSGFAKAILTCGCHLFPDDRLLAHVAGLVEYHHGIANYLNKKGAMVIFLFRRNTLRRLISVEANNYDRRTKQLNGIHKSHVHSKDEADILARFKPKMDVSTLIPSIVSAERSMRTCLDRFSNTRHMILYYEDVIRDPNALSRVQEFLGVPVKKLFSKHVKIHTRPLPDLVDNWEDVSEMLNGTEYTRFLDDRDYVK
ncbi:hypothetical protein PR202_ga25658 [Eleusine coracana subsp. coracana]|uniref:Ubiquitin-like domain-containing protein n=1 Tax=Eleusine coracana subsp. coracana TaxID=191504 RepID=A0AAV5DCT9_ELECO|nr:hypothetical protein PR202_ga25658 [Eleusine coracana subsp. coracana]